MIEYLTEQEVLNMDTNYIIETKNLTKQYVQILLERYAYSEISGTSILI